MYKTPCYFERRGTGASLDFGMGWAGGFGTNSLRVNSIFTLLLFEVLFFGFFKRETMP